MVAVVGERVATRSPQHPRKVSRLSDLVPCVPLTSYSLLPTGYTNARHEPRASLRVSRCAYLCFWFTIRARPFHLPGILGTVCLEYFEKRDRRKGRWISRLPSPGSFGISLDDKDHRDFDSSLSFRIYSSLFARTFVHPHPEN